MAEVRRKLWTSGQTPPADDPHTPPKIPTVGVAKVRPKRGKDRKPIELKTSFRHDSPEVTSMAKQVEQLGRCTTAMEFTQGQHDFNRGCPARTYAVYDDGRRIELTGEDPIVREGLIEVVHHNHGPGFMPSNMADLRHDAEGPTVGRWGRGTKSSSAYLVSKGIGVLMSSSCEAPDGKVRSWKGRFLIKPNSVDGQLSVFIVGSWVDDPPSGSSFRIVGPDENYLSQLERLPFYFLPANPRYADATVVRVSPRAPPLLLDWTMPTEEGQIVRVQCLHDRVVERDAGSADLFVDGTRLTDHRSYYGDYYRFTWALQSSALLSPPYDVDRDFDSGTTRRGDARYLIQLALRNSSVPAMFSELLEIALTPDAELPRELQGFQSDDAQVSAAAQECLLRLWAERCGAETLLASEPDTVKQLSAQGIASRFVRGAMQRWLKSAGVPLAEPILEKVVKRERFVAGRSIAVTYANDPDALTRLFEEAGDAEIAPRIEEVAGKKEVTFELPYSIGDERDVFDRFKPGATWARVAAVVAHEMGLDVTVTSQRGDRASSLVYSVRRDEMPYGFITTLETITQPAESPLAPDQGNTRITLKGELLQQLEPPPGLADALARIAARRAQTRGRQRRAVRETLVAVKPEPPESVDWSRRSIGGVLRTAAALALGGGAISLLPSVISDLGNPFERDEFQLDDELGRRIGSATAPLGVFDLSTTSGVSFGSQVPLALHSTRIEGLNGASIDGYYRQFVGSQFVINHATGRAQWIDQERYRVLEGVPRHTSERARIAVHYAGLTGQVRLPIREGDALLGISSAGPVKVLVEESSRNIVLEGAADSGEVVAYLGPHRRPNAAPPSDALSESLLDISGLRPDWRSTVLVVRDRRDLSLDEKAAVVLGKWSAEYTYNDDPRLDVQVTGTSGRDVATAIVNIQQGLCNNAATGAVALLREAGVPARTVIGPLRSARGPILHMWLEYWNGKEWRAAEPLFDSKINSRTREHVTPYFEAIRAADLYRATGALLQTSAQAVADVGRGIDELLHGRAHIISPSDLPSTREVLKDLALVAAGAGAHKLYARMKMATQKRRG